MYLFIDFVHVFNFRASFSTTSATTILKSIKSYLMFLDRWNLCVYSINKSTLVTKIIKSKRQTFRVPTARRMIILYIIYYYVQYRLGSRGLEFVKSTAEDRECEICRGEDTWVLKRRAQRYTDDAFLFSVNTLRDSGWSVNGNLKRIACSCVRPPQLCISLTVLL